ncbi:MAG: DUF3313 domain-containing protein [Candidatus Omnitrophica bacterium]|nr:DUF3313 domain-containing protein [Candidatus Omnitrophota bacterium]
MNNKWQKLCLFLMILLLVGCSTAGKTKYSGFLNDYSRMQPSEEMKGLMVEEGPMEELQFYEAFMVDPVVAYLDPEVEQKIKPEKLDELVNLFHEELVLALEEAGYKVVDEPGENVLLIRAAITEIDPSMPLLNIHWSTTLAGWGTGGASLEAEFLDSKTGDRIFAIVDARKGRKFLNVKGEKRKIKAAVSNYAHGLTRYGHTKDAFEQWTGFLIDTLNEWKL